MMTAFGVWFLMAFCFMGLGIYNFFSKKKSAFGFGQMPKYFP